MHGGGDIIRVNGSYFKNTGPNVADVSNDTDSWNLGCIAYGSKANLDQNSDFMVSTATAEMWIDNCFGYGSTNSLNIGEIYSKAYIRDSKLTTEKLIGLKYAY